MIFVLWWEEEMYPVHEFVCCSCCNNRNHHVEIDSSSWQIDGPEQNSLPRERYFSFYWFDFKFIADNWYLGMPGSFSCDLVLLKSLFATTNVYGATLWWWILYLKGCKGSGFSRIWLIPRIFTYPVENLKKQHRKPNPIIYKEKGGHQLSEFGVLCS